MLKGYVHPNFSEVANVFRRQIPTTGRGGAAVCVYHKGECVVDLWGGSRTLEGDHWEQDTLSLSFSTTKGVASTLLHVCAGQGLIHYDAPVARYWPEFAQNGKSQITVRQVLCHEAGLFGIRDILSHANEMTNWQSVISLIEQAAPRHRPGEANGYHGLTYGYLVGEIIQRVTGQSFSEALKEKIADPLGLDGLYVGLPEEEFHRRAYLIKPNKSSPSDQHRPASRFSRVKAKVIRQLITSAILLSGANPAHIRSGLMPRGMSQFDFNADDVVSSCMPSANGMFTARSLARLYGAMACGGQLDGERILSPQRIEQMGQVQNNRRDKVVPIPMRWRLGYHRVFTTGPKTPHAFGHFGFGGSGAWCDPSRELAVAMTLNSGIGTPFGDSRIANINTAAIKAAEQVEEARRMVPALLSRQ